MFKKDNLLYGVILGLFAPVAGMIAFYFWKFSSVSFTDFIKFLGIEKKIITSMVSVSLFMNAILFTIYINRKKDSTAKGIFYITCVYAIATLLLKLVF